MTKIEKETIINFNEAENQASVYTFNKRLINKLKKLCEKFPDKFQYGQKYSDGALEFVIQKKYVLISKPRSQKSITNKQKERLRAEIMSINKKRLKK